jgi:dihydrofolate reductase
MSSTPDRLPNLTVIAAVARNGVIGRAGAIPWRLPADMAHFRALTRGCPMIMGRRTWDSLPERFRPLPERTNIVVTRQAGWRAAGALAATSLDDALAQARTVTSPQGQVFVMGGGELYTQALPRADTLELTELQADITGDTVFPSWNRDDFIEVRREAHAAAGPDAPAFHFVTYRRVSQAHPRP